MSDMKPHKDQCTGANWATEYLKTAAMVSPQGLWDATKFLGRTALGTTKAVGKGALAVGKMPAGTALGGAALLGGGALLGTGMLAHSLLKKTKPAFNGPQAQPINPIPNI